MNRVVVILLVLLLQNSRANCPEILLQFVTKDFDQARIVDFKQQWLARVTHQLDQNIFFISEAKLSNIKKTYFQLENAVLKELNDKVLLDKDLVTSLDNYLKANFLERIKNSVILEKHLAAFYVDFKSLRLQFNSDLPTLNAELNRIYRESINDFVAVVDEIGLDRFYSRASGLAQNPHNWYFAGVGKSNDQANFATRIGRTLFPVKGQNHMVNFKNHINVFVAKLKNIESLRRQLWNQFGELFDEQGILKLEVIEILRKVNASNLDEYVMQFKKRVKDRYQLDLPRAFVVALRDYYSNADLFSPALLIEQRVLIDMSKSIAGNISVDISGMGARNMRALMDSLVKYDSKEIDQILNLIRQSEVKATEELEHLRKIIADSLEKVEIMRKGRFDDTIQATGDDLIFFPQNGGYQRRHQLQFLNQLALYDESSSFRVVFLPQKDLQGRDIIYSKRMGFINLGESLEKDLRLALESKLPFERLKKMNFGIDLAVDDGGLNFSLIVMGGQHGDQKVIQSLARNIIELKKLGKFNEIIII